MVLQMRSRNNGLSLILCCSLLVACSSQPEKQSFLGEQAYKLSQRADAAFMEGAYERAKADYLQALRISLSLENAADIAAVRINLARVFRGQALPGQAHLRLDALFLEPALPYPPTMLAAACALKSLLYLESDEPSAALIWAEKGERYCRKACAVAGSLLLLRAQLAQRDNRLDEALEFADAAADVLDSGLQEIELANAKRLSGEISLAKSDHTRSIRMFQQALVIDQKLGIPFKIRLDLLRLGEAHERSGAAALALHYYARALTVSEAMGSRQGADEARAHMEKLQNNDGAGAPEPH